MRRLLRSARAPKLAAALLGAASTLALPQQSRAFCGFYVAGADAKLFNDATVVVLMREGKRTVLSMQNDYQGPPEDFALVIPVPVVLEEADVKILRRELFERVETLASPRLVEYWEQDPCMEGTIGLGNTGLIGRGGGGSGSGYGRGSGATPQVVVEAEFTVGEYEIVVLSAKESNALDSWLRANDYNIPAGAEPLLRPYVEQDMKFFVAKVNPEKVEFDDQGRASLSPLRFHYDSDEFALPVRLGLINAPDPRSGGKQDLLIHILAKNTRYEAANYPNVTIPTNLDVQPGVRERFGQFYVSLFDHTLAQHPGAVVTEYSWGATKCDPCPGPSAALTSKELLELGADVIGEGGGADLAAPPIPGVRQAKAQVVGKLDADVVRRIVRAHINEIRSCYARGLQNDPTLAGRVVVSFKVDATGKVSASEVGESSLTDESVAKCMAHVTRRWKFPKPPGGGEVVIDYPYVLSPQQGGGGWGGFGGAPNPFVLTRLHARYDASSLGEDLVFQTADPIVGGREFATDDAGTLERGAQPGATNNFQGRYAIRHPWEGEIACEKPTRGVWGGPPEGHEQDSSTGAGAGQPVVARELTRVERGAALSSFVTASAADELALDAPAPRASEAAPAKGEDAAGSEEPPSSSATPPAGDKAPGCACSSPPRPGGHAALAALLGLLGGLGLAVRRRRR